MGARRAALVIALTSTACAVAADDGDPFGPGVPAPGGANTEASTGGDEASSGSTAATASGAGSADDTDVGSTGTGTPTAPTGGWGTSDATSTSADGGTTSGTATTTGPATTSAGTTTATTSLGSTTGTTTGAATTTAGGTNTAPCSGPHYVFVTSNNAAGNANFGGLAGGDAHCQNRAIGAGLPGNWIAVLSSTTIDARDRICIGGPVYAAVTTTQAYPSTLQIATDEASWWSPSHLAAINHTELGTLTNATWVRTGTDPFGSTTGTDVNRTNCANWTSGTGFATGGNPNATNGDWIDETMPSCFAGLPLYCISQ